VGDEPVELLVLGALGGEPVRIEYLRREERRRHEIVVAADFFADLGEVGETGKRLQVERSRWRDGLYFLAGALPDVGGARLGRCPRSPARR
jgi:hypothetical protein